MNLLRILKYHSPTFRSTTFLSSPTTPHLHSPEYFTSTMWRKKATATRLFSLNDFVPDKISIGTVCRAAAFNMSQVCVEDDLNVEELDAENGKEDYICYIRSMLSSIGDGRISVSPYDTAWIALIKEINGQDTPQFPSSLQWIVQNQLPDGSWGDEHFFCATDRLVNTLACIVALKSWDVHVDMCEKGISFIKEHLYELQNVNAEHVNCGFEVVFPALLERAKNLGIDGIPYDDYVIKEIYAAKDQKLKRIPKEVMHEVPTTLLYSLEGFEDLDWHKLLKLQAKDGSFLTSPSSTAFAFMQTNNQNCLKFIDSVVQRFNGGAPHTYPVDLFARLWAVDRLQRLGISRYFEPETNDFLSHVHRFWSEKGVFSGRDCGFSDIDVTSMGFRLLRLHGYDMSPDVFMHFKTGKEFTCFGGQMIESSTPIFNLYRASQLQFPGEEILKEARDFSYSFLQQRLAGNQLLDKWVVSKNLADEIRHGLDIPWYSSLSRIETRFYLEYYGGDADVWNGKTWYRMPDINNNEYLKLARIDFNQCQEQHQIEWTHMQAWYDKCNMQEFGVTRNDLLRSYFLSTASIFELERSKERVAWAKSQIISKMIASFFKDESTPLELKLALLAKFRDDGRRRTNSEQGLVTILSGILGEFLNGFDRGIHHHLREAWGAWLRKLHRGSQEDGELLATTINITAGHDLREEIVSHPEYRTLSRLTNKVCRGLSENKSNLAGVEQEIQELVQLVLTQSGGINRNIKNAFLLVAKTFYYASYTAAATTQMHIHKVLFERVV